jgi:hypothetical protein
MSLSHEAREWLEAQNNEFMNPFAYHFTADEAAELNESYADGYLDDEDKSGRAGWYSRLSAPGYLDCTDWLGPFETEDEAFEALYDMYGE